MLFDSFLRKDLSRNFLATLVVILTIVMTIMLIRTLGQASRGTVNPAEVLMIMGFSVTSQLATVLALSLFIAIIATLSRVYSDSEMVIWLSAGRSLFSFVPVLMRFAWPVLLAIGLLAVFAWPWSNQQIRDLQDRYQQRNDVERVAPGRFQESSGGRRVFFIDKDSPDQTTGTNVFISARENDLESTTTARLGRIEWRQNERYLVLAEGEQWLNQPSTGELRWTRFAHFDILIDTDKQHASSRQSTRHVDTLDLIRQPTPLNLGELSWRLGAGLCAFNFTLLALPLSAVNPRRGRSYQFALAMLAFIVYYNLLNLGQNWISHGRYGLITWMLMLHGSAFFIAALWIWLQHRQWSWRDLLPRNSARSST